MFDVGDAGCKVSWRPGGGDDIVGMDCKQAFVQPVRGIAVVDQLTALLGGTES